MNAPAARMMTVGLVVLAAIGAPAAQSPARPAAGARPASKPASKPASPSEQLWAEVSALRTPLPPGKTSVERNSQRIDRRRRLLERVRLYRSLYPGGKHADEVVQIEFQTLFEIGTLTDGDLAPLRARVRECLAHPDSRAAEAEAAYWRILCDRLTIAPTTSQPYASAFGGTDPALLADYRAYVQKYPQSRFVPRLVTLLFEAAQRDEALPEMRRCLERMAPAFAEHPVTQQIAAQLRRHEARDEPFDLAFVAVDGRRINTADWRGTVVLVVVWSPMSAAARDCVSAIEEQRRAHADDLHVVGVSLEPTPEQTRAAARDLNLPWPQWNEQRGWAGPFLLEWGVRETPFVFVIDRQGRLLDARGEPAWRDAVARVLGN